MVDLSFNKIGDRGARNIARLLANPATLIRTLKLSNNLIGLKGISDIGRALERNKDLNFLDLKLNCLGDEGGVAILTSLVKSNGIVSIELGGNGLEYKSLAALCHLLKQSPPCLSRIDISSNKLTDYEKDTPASKGDLRGKFLVEAMGHNKVPTY